MIPDVIEPDHVAAEPESPSRFRRASGWAHGQANKVVVFTGILLFLVIYFAPDIFYSIRSGEVGVLYLRFAGGTQTDRVLGEGMKIIPPWDKLFIYNVRVQEVKHSMDVLTSEGLKVKLDLSIRYHPELEMVGLLHQQVGPDYADKIVIPEVESSLRTAMAGTSLHDVYGSERGLVQTIINDSIEHISQKFVRLDEIVLRQVELPASNPEDHRAEDRPERAGRIVRVPARGGAAGGRAARDRGRRPGEVQRHPRQVAFAEHPEMGGHPGDEGAGEVAQRQDRHHRQQPGPAAHPGRREAELGRRC